MIKLAATQRSVGQSLTIRKLAISCGDVKLFYLSLFSFVYLCHISNPEVVTSSTAHMMVLCSTPFPTFYPSVC